MPVDTREALLARTFVEVADALVGPYDVVDLLSVLAARCVELFDVDEAGLMLADNGGRLSVAASSSEAMQFLELFEIQHDDGPCVDSFRNGQMVSCEDLDPARHRWPAFMPEAVGAGIRSVFALPLRLRDQTIGSLNLLRREIGPLDSSDLLAAQAIANAATIGVSHHHVRARSEQLQHALDSRVIIEQAKGILAASIGLDVDIAFMVLRHHARSHNQQLTSVAHAIVAGDLTAEAVAREIPRPPSP
jgi:GAF domain-containing protein